MQSFKDRLRIAWLPIPHLKLLSKFSEMIRANKEAFIFRQGNCTMNVLRWSLSKSFVSSIFSRNPMKYSTLGYFSKRTYNQMHRKLQPWWLLRRWLLCSILSGKISHSHITSHVLFAKTFKYLRRKWFRKFRFAK